MHASKLSAFKSFRRLCRSQPWRDKTRAGGHRLVEPPRNGTPAPPAWLEMLSSRSPAAAPGQPRALEPRVRPLKNRSILISGARYRRPDARLLAQGRRLRAGVGRAGAGAARGRLCHRLLGSRLRRRGAHGPCARHRARRLSYARNEDRRRPRPARGWLRNKGLSRAYGRTLRDAEAQRPFPHAVRRRQRCDRSRFRRRNRRHRAGPGRCPGKVQTRGRTPVSTSSSAPTAFTRPFAGWRSGPRGDPRGSSAMELQPSRSAPIARATRTSM